MTKLAFTKRVLELDYNGESLKVDFPSMKQLRLFVADTEKEENSETEIVKTMDFLESLGIPKSLLDEMEPEHLQEILSVLLGTKKK